MASDEVAQDASGAHASSSAFQSLRNPRLVAKACLVRKSFKSQYAAVPKTQDPFPTALEWSADGTSIVVTTNDYKINTYILPPDLLAPVQTTKPYHELSAYHEHQLPEPSYAVTIYPQFELSRPETCLYLASPRELPIRLISPFAEGLLSTYPLTHASTERWIAPHSLLFDRHNSNFFYAGSDGFIAMFDLHSSGQGPTDQISTSSRSKRRGGPAAVLAANSAAGRSIHGIVSTMAISEAGHLAAGTFSGDVGIIDSRCDQSSSTVSKVSSTFRTGITTLLFKPVPSSANHLLTASRMSNEAYIFDLRNMEHAVCILKGRSAMTQQRLGVGFSETGDVLAGGSDGRIRVWENPLLCEGAQEPTWDFSAHDDAVGGVGSHPLGAAVIASCAGSRRHDQDSEGEVAHSDDLVPGEMTSATQQGDDCIKIWA